MPIASISLDFDPIVRIGDTAVRLETLAQAGAIFVALLLGAAIATRTPVAEPAYGASASDHLRLDDFLFVVLGIVPGAVILGRLGYVLLHLDYYAASPTSIIDPGQGSLELGLAVTGGFLTGTYVAGLLEGPIGRWLHIAAIPVLVGLALGKAAMALGGDGQGALTDVAWATAYTGPGPWASLGPGLAAHPSQLYEALVTLLVLALVLAISRAGPLARRDGRIFFVAIALWAVGRTLVGTTWRDAEVAGPLRAGQLVGLGLVLVFGFMAIAGPFLARRIGGARRAEPHWPDPQTRPPF